MKLYHPGLRPTLLNKEGSFKVYGLYAAINRQLVASEEVRRQKPEVGSLKLRVLVCGFCGKWRCGHRAANLP